MVSIDEMVLHDAADDGWIELTKVGCNKIVIGRSWRDRDGCSGGFGGDLGLLLFFEVAKVCSTSKAVAGIVKWDMAGGEGKTSIIQ